MKGNAKSKSFADEMVNDSYFELDDLKMTDNNSDEEIIDLDRIANSDLLTSNEEIRNTMRQYTNTNTNTNNDIINSAMATNTNITDTTNIIINNNNNNNNNNNEYSSSSKQEHDVVDDNKNNMMTTTTTTTITTPMPIAISNRNLRNVMPSNIIQHTKTLRVHIDERQYVTIPVTHETTVQHAIDFICKKKAFDVNENQIYFFIDEKLQPLNTRLYPFLGGGLNPIRPISHTFEIQMKPKYIKNSDANEHSKNTLSPFSPSASNSPNLRTRGRSQVVRFNLSIFSQITVTHVDDDAQNSRALKHAEDNLKMLKDQEFKVIKLGFWGRKQERILKLTRNGIENIEFNRNGLRVVTSFHTWENVKTSCLTDHETIQISYKDRKEDRIYKGINVASVNDAIQARLNILKQSKNTAQREDFSMKCHRSLLQKQIQEARNFKIGDKVRLTRSRVGIIVWIGEVDFAPNKHYGIELSEGQGDHDGKVNGKQYFTLQTIVDDGGNTRKAVIVPESQILRKVGMARVADKRNSKTSVLSPSLSAFPMTTPRRISQRAGMMMPLPETMLVEEDMIFREVRNSILRNDTVEGRSRNNFMSKWNKYAKSEKILSTVRQFMNALKDHILDKKGDDFRQRLLKQRQQSSASPISDSSPTKSINSPSLVLDKTNNMFLSIESAERIHTELDLAAVDPLTMTQINETISALIESAIEQTVLQSKLTELTEICVEMTKDETKVLKAKIAKLLKEDQSFFDIKPAFQHSDNWRSAVYELSLFKDCLLPSEKITALVNTAKAIYDSHESALKEKEEKSGKPRKEDSFITGDDLLPIVTYVLVNASKNGPVLTDSDLMLLDALLDPEQQRSEAGYYLTVFHAATQWITAYQ